MGWSNFLHNFLSGGDRKISDPAAGGGFFKPGSVGAAWGDYLKDSLGKDITATPQYRAQSAALRDELRRESGAAGEQFSLATNAGGFYDSGARLQGLREIDRSRMASMSTGLAEILSRLEHERMTAAFPFLQSQISGFTAYENARLGAEQAGNFRANAHAQAVIGGFTGGMGGGGGGGAMGGYAPQAGYSAAYPQAARTYGTYLGAGTDF